MKLLTSEMGIFSKDTDYWCHTVWYFLYITLSGMMNDFSRVKFALADSNPLDMKYAVIMDAGSSGTRIRVYSWNKDHEGLGVPQITELHESENKTRGVSSFWNETDKLETYIRALIDTTRTHVPEAEHDNTPSYIMATAGLRLVGERNATNLLQKVREIMANKSINPYIFTSRNARILSGEEEGVFAWLAVNYLSGYFDGRHEESDFKGIVEMGGASLQIAFMPKDPILADKFSLLVGGRLHSLYVHSYLGYGQNQVVTKIAEYIAKNNSWNDSREIEDPCKLQGHVLNQTIHKVNYTFRGTGDPSSCVQIIQNLFFNPIYRDMCSPHPCAIGSFYQPTLPQSKTMYALSAFEFVVNSLKGPEQNENEEFTPRYVRLKANDYCKKNFSEAVSEGSKTEFISVDCTMGLYIPLVLGRLGFSDSTSLIAKKKVNGQSVEWTLGAIIYELEQQPEQCDPITARVSAKASHTMTFYITFTLTLVLGILLT